jgi:uncharacterized repeat protein (TIGR03803 family)
MKKNILLCIGIFFTTSLSVVNAQYTKLLDFAGVSNGKYPLNSLVSDGQYLYGMTFDGGSNELGTIFKIMPDGTGYSKLLDFEGSSNGSYPLGALIYNAGILYGMTGYGGTNNIGTIFKILPDGTGYTKLLDFAGENGSYPFGHLFATGGFLYGMTSQGGSSDLGTMFKISMDGSGYSKLLDFTGPANGSYPQGNFTFMGGLFYGMTTAGGANDLGSIFKVSPDGTEYTKLQDLADGSVPIGYLVSDGTFLYGLTSGGGINNLGIIFKIKPDGSEYTKMLDFDGLTNGSNPYGSLIYFNGFLYGTTTFGGSNDMGTVFKILPNGTGFTKLFDFSTNDGNNPIGTLISDGIFLYGMAYQGGTNNMGTIFRIRDVSCNVSVSAGSDQNCYFGYGPEQCVTKTASASGGVQPYTYVWTLNRRLICNSANETFTGSTCSNNACASLLPPSYTGATITVCLMDTAELCVTVTDAVGCTYTDCAMIFGEDVRCSSGNSANLKVNVCHNGKSICVEPNAVASHLAHGDFLGKCAVPRLRGNDENDITVFPNPGTGMFSLHFSNIIGETVDVEIFNFIGQSVFTAQYVNKQQTFDQSCDLTRLQSGTYFMRIGNSSFSEMQKVIISH